jgi:tetratricopeptide (TPR) repeat protein
LNANKSAAKSTEDGFQAAYSGSIRGLAAYSFTMAAIVYQRNDDLASAEKWFLRALSLDPNRLECYMGLASLYREERRLPDAIAIHQRMVELQPDNIVNYTNLASVAMQAGDETLAEKTLQQASQRDEANGTPCWLLARLYLATGRNAEALEFAMQAANRMKNVDAYLILMSAYQANGDPAGAANALEKARQVAPNDPRLANVGL